METSVIYAIKSCFDSLSSKERTIAEYIASDPKASVSPSIDELSKKIGVSESTMVRFVRKLGFTGYQEFRICLARETIPIDTEEFRQDLDSVEAAWLSAENSLRETKANLNHSTVEKAGDMIRDCRRLYIAGMGGSGIIAHDMFRRFSQTGLTCQFAEDFHTQLLLASQSCEEDTAFIFSHSGIDIDAIDLARIHKSNGCRIIITTCMPNSPITKLADLVLLLSNTKPSPIAEVFSERIASMVLVDALYLELISKSSERWAHNIKANKDVITTRRM